MGLNLFPFHLVSKGSKIILYGAGNVGKQFYKQVKSLDYVELIKWVDQNYKEYQVKGLPVDSVEMINLYSYDFIVIAVADKKLADNIYNILVSRYCISSDKIIYYDSWVGDNIPHCNIYQNADEKDTILIDPKTFLNKNRWDLAVRYLVAKDFVHDVENKANLSLYSRMILCRSNAIEERDYFSEYTRDGISEYLQAFKKVCLSMRENGYERQKFIPVGDNNIFLNGSHRIAAAMALNEKVWIKHYVGRDGFANYGENWFEKNGFNVDDKIRILRAYADLYEYCGIILLFGPCMDQWKYLQAQLVKRLDIVGSIDLDFSNHYIAYENLIHEIYGDLLWRNMYIDRKLELLKMSPLVIRVMLVSGEKDDKCNLYETIGKIKQELRDQMFFDTNIAPVVMHGSDSYKEFIQLKQTLLSVNNLKHLKMRMARNYSEEFVGRLERLKLLLQEKNIDIQDVCITGSSSWEILGLRKAVDIDFSVAQKYRKDFGDEHLIWENLIEYNRRNCVEVSRDKVYVDNLLIEDDNYHFFFGGFKFVNPEIIAQKKAYNHREKDIRDVRLYELFKDFVMNFDYVANLKKQIENEFYKKR